MVTNNFQTELTGMQNSMFNFAMLLTSNESAAYDLTQDTTLQAIECESEYSGKESLKSWLYTMMRNIFIANYRNTPANAIFAVEQYHINVGSEAGLEAPEGAHTVEEMTAHMSVLDANDRMAYQLFATGYSLSEISERMSEPVATIRRRVARANASF